MIDEGPETVTDDGIGVETGRGIRRKTTGMIGRGMTIGGEPGTRTEIEIDTMMTVEGSGIERGVGVGVGVESEVTRKTREEKSGYTSEMMVKLLLSFTPLGRRRLPRKKDARKPSQRQKQLPDVKLNWNNPVPLPKSQCILLPTIHSTMQT